MTGLWSRNGSLLQANWLCMLRLLVRWRLHSDRLRMLMLLARRRLHALRLLLHALRLLPWALLPRLRLPLLLVMQLLMVLVRYSTLHPLCRNRLLCRRPLRSGLAHEAAISRCSGPIR